MSQPYIWVHEDALSREHLVFKAAGESARAVFIWDTAYFEQQAYSLKRLTFIYECLIDLCAQDGPIIDVFQGHTETVLRELCVDGRLYVADTPNPIFLEVVEGLSQVLPVEIVKNVPFIEAPDDVDMTRFFRFWNRSRRSAFGFDALNQTAEKP